MNALPTGAPDHGWFVERLTSTMSFGNGTGLLIEDWSIVAERALNSVLIDLNLDPELSDPRRGAAGDRRFVDAIGAEVVPGAEVSDATGRRAVVLRLPNPIGPRQSHDFHLRMPIPGADLVERHVCEPLVRCRWLEVRVHFDRSSVPARVCAIAGDPHRPGPDLSASPQVPVNLVGEAEIHFDETVLGRRYGLDWSAS